MVTLKGFLPTKDDFALAAGAATSGTITGYIKQVIPINLEFLPGMTEFITGILIGKFVFKKGMAHSFAKGVAIAGLSNMIASFIPQFAGTFPGQKPQGMLAKTNTIPHAYIHRNPIETITENVVAPHGTIHLKQQAGKIKLPY